MRVVNIVALILLIIGGLNWGLVGVFDFDLVAALFGVGTAVTRAVYTVVGIAALWEIVAMVRSLSSPGARHRDQPAL